MSKPTSSEIVRYLFDLDKGIIINNVMYWVIRDYDVFEVEKIDMGFSRTVLFNDKFNIKEVIDCDSEGNNVTFYKIYYNEHPVSIINENGWFEHANYIPKSKVESREYKRFFELTQTRKFQIVYNWKICDVKVNSIDNKSFDIICNGSVLFTINQENLHFDLDNDLRINYDGAQPIRFIVENELKYSSQID